MARLSEIRTRAPSGGFARLAAMLVAGGAAMALGNVAAARIAERKRPPRGAFLDVDGVRLHYRDEGEGDPILLLHGNAVTAEDFVTSGLFEELAAHHRVIAIDRPGYGYSSRPSGKRWTAAEQAELMMRAQAKLGVERPIVLGHSWGTLVALNMALRDPVSARGLVLISGYYEPTPRLDALAVAPAAAPGLGAVLRYTSSPILGRLMTPAMVRLLFSPAEPPPRFRAEYSTEMAVRPSQLAASAVDGARMVEEARSLYPAVETLDLPLLLIGGRADRIVSFAKQSEAFARRHPQAEVLAIEGAGHMAHHVATAKVREAIEDFIARLGPTSTGAETRERASVEVSA